MSRLSVLACAVLVASTGCRVSPAGKTATIVSGIGLGVVGGVVMSQGPVDSDGDGTNEWFLNDNLGAYLGGTVLLIAGLALLGGGLAAEVEEEREVIGPLPVAPAAHVTFAPPSLRAPSVALPELPASPPVLRLGQQVRSASMRGDCAGAWIMWEQLAAIDVDYADALRAGPVMAPCSRVTTAGTVSTSTMREAPSQRDIAPSIEAGVTAR